MASVEISSIEALALNKLAMISGALAASLKDQTAASEQRALTKVLVDVVNRADAALASRLTKEPARDEIHEMHVATFGSDPR